MLPSIRRIFQRLAYMIEMLIIFRLEYYAQDHPIRFSTGFKIIKHEGLSRHNVMLNL